MIKKKFMEKLMQV